MNYKTTLELLAALLIIGGYFLFVERDLLTTHDREKNQSQDEQQRGTALFTADQFPTESIDSATIQWQGDDAPVVLTKQGQDWVQTQPVTFPLNTWSVRQLIDDAASLRYTQRFEPATAEGKDLPTLNRAALSPPKAVVRLQSSGPKAIQHTIRLGKTTLGGRAYAMINDDPYIYLVNVALHRQVVDSKITDWRKMTLDVPTEGRARQVSLTHAGQTIQMHKTDGRWSFGPPYSGRVDSEAVANLLQALGGMYISKFVADQPEDLSVYGLDQPVLVLDIHLPVVQTEASSQPAATQSTTAPSDQDISSDAADQAEPSPQTQASTLRIGAAEDLNNQQYFAAWSPDGGSPEVVFTISKADAQKFNMAVDDLRDARITPLAPNDVKEISLDRAQGGKIDLLRSSAGWSFVPPGPGFEADSAAVSKLVESVTQAKAQSYQAVEDAVLDNPLATIRLATVSVPEPDLLKVYASDESDLYAVRRNDEVVIYQVPTNAMGEIFEPASYWRQRIVWSIDADQVDRVNLTRPDSPPYVFERLFADAASADAATQPAAIPPTTQPAVTWPGTWRLVDSENFESSAFEGLLAAMSSLRVKRWLDAPASPPSEPTVVIEIETADSGTYTLAVDPDRRLGTIDPTADSAQWFELDLRVMDLLQGEYRDRTLFAIGISDIESITVAGEEESITLRQDESGRYVADGDRAVDQAAAGTLFDTLAGLRVKRYLPPAHVPQPPLKFEVKTHAGKSYRLAFSVSDDGKNVATDGEQWFTLDAQTITRLSTPGVLQN